MIEGLRRWAARREVRAALAARRARPLPPDPRRRTVLVALPGGEDALRQAWALLDAFDVVDSQVAPVRAGEGLGYVPDRWAGGVRVIGPDEYDWRRLPSRHARHALWTQRPDLALNLAEPSDLGAALLVGASPAAVRVGVHARDREPFYDLMVRAEPADAIAALGRLLRRLDPPLLPPRRC